MKPRIFKFGKFNPDDLMGFDKFFYDLYEMKEIRFFPDKKNVFANRQLNHIAPAWNLSRPDGFLYQWKTNINIVRRVNFQLFKQDRSRIIDMTVDLDKGIIKLESVVGLETEEVVAHICKHFDVEECKNFFNFSFLNKFYKKISIKETIITLGSLATISGLVWGVYIYFKPNNPNQSDTINNEGNNNLNLIGDNNTIISSDISASSTPDKGEENILKKNPEEIISELRKIDNEIRAEKLFEEYYKGKKVKWEGAITSFKKESRIDYNYLEEGGENSVHLTTYLTIYFSGENFFADFFDENFINELSTHNKGDKLEVIGILELCNQSYCSIKAESYREIDKN